MKILILNGSPKDRKSNTMNLTNAFITGMEHVQKNNIEIVDVINKDIKPCRGCFGCWTKTPGKCVISDDMDQLREKYINADIIIWSFPL